MTEELELALNLQSFCILFPTKEQEVYRHLLHLKVKMETPHKMKSKA